MTAVSMVTARTVRLGRFVTDRFFPPVYAGYGLLWTVALESLARLLSGHRFTPSGATGVRAVTVVLVLLFARMLDEQKDLGHDRLHHPDRPLVTGAITGAELRAWMAVLAIGAVSLNLALSPAAAALAAAAPAYCLALAWCEDRWAGVRDGILTNLALAYPAQLVLTGYVYGSLVSAGTIRGDWRAVPVAVVFAGAFLQFEVTRKTTWDADDGQRRYSTVLGPVPAALAAFGCATVAACGAAALSVRHSPAGWLPLVPLVFPAVGTARFLHRRTGDAPRAPAMAFILALYAVLIGLGAAGPGTGGG